MIRACQDRRLADQAGRLKEALAQAPVLGETTVAVRGRGNQAARPAVMAIRSVRSIWTDFGDRADGKLRCGTLGRSRSAKSTPPTE